jgi:hypothetical protein
MIRFLRIVLLGIVGAALAAFGVANRHLVRFVVDPLVPAGQSGPSVEAPLSLFLFVALLIGVVVGGSVVWWGQGKWRRLARLRAKETHELRRDVDRLTSQLRALEEPRLIAMPAPGTSASEAASGSRRWLTH